MKFADLVLLSVFLLFIIQGGRIVAGDVGISVFTGTIYLFMLVAWILITYEHWSNNKSK